MGNAVARASWTCKTSSHVTPLQMSLSVLIPFIILVVVFPVNWAAGLILLADCATGTDIPWHWVGVSGRRKRKNFKALSSEVRPRPFAVNDNHSSFHDRTSSETEVLKGASEVFRTRTMDVSKESLSYRLLCLSSSRLSRLRWRRFTLVFTTSRRA